MDSIAANLKLIESCDYRVILHFTLPEQAWWPDFCDPLEMKLAQLRINYASDRRALTLLDANQAEIDLFRRHSESYGYVFYIMQGRS